MFDIVTPDLIVAQDASIAQKLDSCMNEGQDNTPRLILEMPSDGSSSSSPESWQSLDTIMQNSSDSATLHDLSINRTSDDVILVLMTSGTTSLPKGCPHTNRSTTSCIRAYNAGGCYNRTRSLCSHHISSPSILPSVSSWTAYLSCTPATSSNREQLSKRFAKSARRISLACLLSRVV